MNKRLLAVGICAALVTPAAYADNGAAQQWGGFYLGLHAGYGKDTNPDQTFIFGGASPDIDKVSGSLVGIQGGYNWVRNDWVMGVEADWSSSNIDGDGLCPNPTYTCYLEVNQMYSLRGRLGKSFGKMLPFVTAGFAGAKIEAGAKPDVFSYSPDTNTHNGWVYGVGLEYAASKKVSARVQLLKYNLGDENYYKGVADESSIELDPLILRVGFNYRFGS